MMSKHVSNRIEASQIGTDLAMAIVDQPYSDKMIHDSVMRYSGSTGADLRNWVDELFTVSILYWPQRKIVATEGVPAELLEAKGFFLAPDFNKAEAEVLTFSSLTDVGKVLLSAKAMRYMDKWRRGMLQLLRDINPERRDVL